MLLLFILYFQTLYLSICMESLKIFFSIQKYHQITKGLHIVKKSRMVYQFITAPAGICDEMPMTGRVRSVVPLLPLSGTAEAIREAPGMSVCCTRTCHPYPSAGSAHPLSEYTQMAPSSVTVNQCCPPGRLYVLAVNRYCVLCICVSVKPHSRNIGPENLNPRNSCK